MLNLRFGGAVVYVPVSSSCAECKLFEIRGSIFHVGDPIIADQVLNFRIYSEYEFWHNFFPCNGVDYHITQHLCKIELA